VCLYQRDGAGEVQEAGLQEGFDRGFGEGLKEGRTVGQLLGAIRWGGPPEACATISNTLGRFGCTKPCMRHLTQDELSCYLPAAR
jgi:hypothetical protein